MMRVERTVAWLTLRQLFSGRRALAVIAFAALPAVVAALSRTGVAEDPQGFLIGLCDTFVVRIVLPLIALILGTGAFGAELEDGTAVYLLTKPVRRWRIAFAKLVTAALLTVAIATTSTFVTGVIVLGLDPQRVVAAFTGGVALGSVLYAAVFVALGLGVRRALIAGFVYVIIWEGTAAQMFAGTRTLSIRQYVLSLTDRIARVEPGVIEARLPAGTAFTMAAAVLVAAAVFTVLRLRRFELTDQR